MATIENDASEPTFRFKRRKLAHSRRTRPEDVPVISEGASPKAATPIEAHSPQTRKDDDSDESTPNLKEILRNRRRPRDRLREAARRAEETKSLVLVPAEVPKQDAFSSRFVAQTGQVVDKDDKQMTEYIEARLAEKNHRLYGWPIPKHLEAAVAIVIAENEQSALAEPIERESRTDQDEKIHNKGSDPTGRLAAGMGKLQEVDLGPDATHRNVQRTEAAFKRLEGGHIEEEQPKIKLRLGRDGKPRRGPKRRNSEDLRRDQMVEAVLREAKLDYFEEAPSTTPAAPSDADNDDAMVEQFRLEFLESIESRQQRKPPQPVVAKGVKEVPKGPKLGGSRSARAAMRLQEEQTAKNKR